MSPETKTKMKALEERLSGLGRLAIAFSGGVDSAFLLKAAGLFLTPGRVLALTARSAIFPGREGREAEALAADLGVDHLTVDFDALALPEIAANPPDRCYYCKSAIFKKLKNEALDRGFPVLADGSNTDDTGDFRPGARAIKELGIVSPLKEAGLSKSEIRQLSSELGLATWNKPAYACLASRFPYGQIIRAEALSQVERAEDYLLSLGFRDVRVRHHGEIARLEVGRDERPRFFDVQLMDQVQSELKKLGFPFVALDLGGYQSGGLNQHLPDSIRNKYRQ